MSGAITSSRTWKDPLAASILMLMMGVVLLVMRSGAISLLVVVAGAILMAYGASALSRGIRGDDSGGVLLGALGCVFGLLLVISSGFFVTPAVYVVAAVLILFGILRLISHGKGRKGSIHLLVGIGLILLGIVFAVYPGSTADVMMALLGLVLIVLSILGIYSSR